MERTLKPAFAKPSEQDLFRLLRKEVNQTVRLLEPKRKFIIRLKAALFPTLYVALYLGAITRGDNLRILYSCYCLLGVLLVLNFLNLIHEAVHNTLFQRKWMNSLYVHFFDLLGANSFIWKVRHIRLHHNYPNVMGWDSDFEQSPMARVFPHGVYTRMHQYQHIYLPLLYPLYLFNWLLVRDFKDFFYKDKLVWKVTTIPRMEYVKLFLYKGLFVFYILVLPVLLLKISWAQMMGAFLLMLFTASIFSLLVLLTPHAVPDSEFPMPDGKGNMPTTWFVHQLNTTNDVTEDTWFTRFFMGCFNYHIAHHLFPSVNHVYYPEVTEVISRFAKEHQLPYRRFPLAVSLQKHYQLLKNNSVQEDIFEETM
ncbi:fatty acid desaturase family protein [Deminuibacter soli]|uniref:Fatty acid desaturase n=1 Tax=Deminuibacter soli TaxID=2291815 RepID=A0A3E1NRH8_9BACT|nr:fatty acid desaturase [Deminuibacter soli]RFM30434.1 fatty acid desaturase [Deminuibacter soli]